MSGGGDSLALMLIAAGWAATRGVPLRVASIDHGLRAEAGAETRFVAARASALGLSCDALRWTPPARGNLMAAARAGRRALLADWARGRGLAAVALGHTRDDQAETVLMALARGGAIDGMAAMPGATRRDGALWLRPMLGVGREALRAWLSARGERWIDDPSNADPRFERARARAALAALAPLGIGAGALATAAEAAARARAALEAATDALAAAAALRRGALGEATFALAPLRAAPDDTALRLLGRALDGARGLRVAPRTAALLGLLAPMRDAKAGRRALAGCLVAWRDGTVAATREPAAAARDAAREAARAPGAVWDGRFRLACAAPGHVGPLGEAGLAALARAARAGWRAPPPWRAAPRAARAATPALWHDGGLACAPLAAYGEGMQAWLADGGDEAAR